MNATVETDPACTARLAAATDEEHFVGVVADAGPLLASFVVDGVLCDGAGGSLDKYSIGKTLGEGGFAVVKLAKLKATGEAFALKLVDKARTAEATMREEIGVMAALGRHPHIVGLVETFETKGAWALVLDLATGGEVFDRICERGAAEYGQKSRHKP